MRYLLFLFLNAARLEIRRALLGLPALRDATAFLRIAGLRAA
jgi:hypothetical protein